MAISLCRDFAEIWYSKADTEIALGMIPEAASSFSTIVSLEPDNAEAWYDYGCVLIDNEDYLTAGKAFNSAIKLKPNWAEPYFEKAKINFIKGELEKGDSNLEMAFSINPSERFEYNFKEDWQIVLDFLVNRNKIVKS